MRPDEPPSPHVTDCAGPYDADCAACRWYEERVAEMHAWQAFLAIVRYQPRDFWGRFGYG